MFKLLGTIVLASPCLWAQGPVLFFSDITSGPNTGGENGNGAYVTIYGNYFGTSQGTSIATAGGGVMVNCKIWGAAWLWYQKIACQLGPGAASGDLVVTVNGLSSNPLPFTVASGNIYFVSTGGSDNNPGSFASPWGSLLNARNVMQPGDITYAMNGVSQSSDDGTGWDSAFLLSGGGQGNWCSATGMPRALVAYPGATVTIGNPTGGLPDFGLRTSDCQGNYVFAGIAFRGQAPAQPGGGAHYRFIASDITCPHTQGAGGGACFATSQASYIYFYGNHVYSAGTENASALFQGVYFSTDSSYVDMGWNLVENVHGCRGVQVHSSPLGSGGPSDPTGHDQYSISIHDNTIHDTQCDGIVVDTVDPSQGSVSLYNNVVYNAGKGPANPEDTGGWNCINIPGGTENGPNGSGTVEIFNNTLFACGAFANPPYPSDNNGIAENGDEPEGAPAIYVHSRNNLIYSVATTLYPAGVPYFVAWNPQTGGLCANTDICPWLYGTNNLLYGGGPPATDLTEIVRSVNENPLVASTTLPDLHLTSGSPASQAGSIIGGIAVYGMDNTGRDHDGLARPAIPAIGAYEIPNRTGTTLIVKLATAGQIEPFAPDSIVSAYGANLAAGTAQATMPLGTTLDGVTATVTDSAGASRAALLFYVSPTQINCEIPDGTAPGAATVTIANSNGTSQNGSITIGAVSPGLFELDTSGLAAAWVLPVVSGVAQNLQAVYQLNSSEVVSSPINLGPASEQVYLELYGTGIRHAANVSVTVGGVSVPVLYAGAVPGFAGEDQVNIGPLPLSLAGKGAVDILLIADGQAANTVNVTIQ
ncbi:MAG TPA: IPT/TIG domain-containing protein [Bryobacteraceae bacterium]|nr:IPT/TIG domain-containing protein [Bryobacteraceae bacterium]